jgi:hypothetical protein
VIEQVRYIEVHAPHYWQTGALKSITAAAKTSRMARFVAL